MTFQEFLAWCSQPSGITIAVGALLAVVMEYWPSYQELAPKAKRLIFAFLCLAVPLLAAQMQVWFYGVAPTWEGLYWEAIVAGFSAFAGGTGTHTLFIGKRR